MAAPELILKTMRMLLTLYPSRSQSDADLKVIEAAWQFVLSDVPDDVLETAVAEYIRSGEKFAPPPGVLRQRALVLMGRDPERLAEEAWRRIYISGFGREPIEDPLVIETLSEIGGFEAIAGCPESRIGWLRDRFIRLYMRKIKEAELALPGRPRLFPEGHRERK